MKLDKPFVFLNPSNILKPKPIGFRNIINDINTFISFNYVVIVVLCYMFICVQARFVYVDIRIISDAEKFKAVIFNDVRYHDSDEGMRYWSGKTNGKEVFISYTEGLSNANTTYKVWYYGKYSEAYFDRGNSVFPKSRILMNCLNLVIQLLLCIFLGYYGVYLKKRQNRTNPNLKGMSKTGAYFLGVGYSLAISMVPATGIPYSSILFYFGILHICIYFIIFLIERPD